MDKSYRFGQPIIFLSRQPGVTKNPCYVFSLGGAKKGISSRTIWDNKHFWKTVKPFSTNTVGGDEIIALIEESKVVSEDKEVAETFKSYFETLVKNLGINSKFMSEEPVSNQSVTGIIKKLQNLPSIIKIKENHQWHFSFSAAETEDVDREIDLLDASKVIQENDIPVKITKANRDIFF